MKIQIIIVAGGKGTRMNSDIPKQFLSLDGKPILMHTIEKLASFSHHLFLVLPKEDIELWQTLVEKHKFNLKPTLIEGGKERFFSVRNALEQCSNEGIILIHDGVRPFVNHKTIQNVIDKTQEKGSAIPVIDIFDSMRLITRTESMPVNREKYKLVQTPQGFEAELIMESYQQNFDPQFTDDASVYESAGYSVSLTDGNKENIKITTPEDLRFAPSLKRNDS